MYASLYQGKKELAGYLNGGTVRKYKCTGQFLPRALYKFGCSAGCSSNTTWYFFMIGLVLKDLKSDNDKVTSFGKSIQGTGTVPKSMHRVFVRKIAKATYWKAPWKYIFDFRPAGQVERKHFVWSFFLPFLFFFSLS